jgi:hypothetical protein
MKANIIENDTMGMKWIDIDLTPETLKEAAILLRLACRRKKICPKVRTTYHETIETYIQFPMNTSSNTPDTGIG